MHWPQNLEMSGAFKGDMAWKEVSRNRSVEEFAFQGGDSRFRSGRLLCSVEIDREERQHHRGHVRAAPSTIRSGSIWRCP